MFKLINCLLVLRSFFSLGHAEANIIVSRLELFEYYYNKFVIAC